MAARPRAAHAAHAPLRSHRGRGARLHGPDDVPHAAERAALRRVTDRGAPDALGRRLLRLLPAGDGLDRRRHRVVAAGLRHPGTDSDRRRPRAARSSSWDGERCDEGGIGGGVRRPGIAREGAEAARAAAPRPRTRGIAPRVGSERSTALCRCAVQSRAQEKTPWRPPSADDLWDNPLGTDGFEFIEYAAPDPAALGRLFGNMGFTAVAKHRSKNVLLYRQGDINFIVNAEPDSFAQAFARVHGPSICAIAFRVKDAALAYRKCVESGAGASRRIPGRWSSTSRRSRASAIR